MRKNIMHSEVEKNLAKWQGLKFGLMMHWGPYSQWGAVESWSICSEDEDWCRRDRNNYHEYVKAYIVLKDGEEATPEEFIEWARGKMAGYKRPKEVALVESLPMSNIGKVLRRELRETEIQKQAND